jgi:hypothetical protein
VPDIIMDGNIRVSSVPSISNIAAPTVAELNAGTRLDTLITPDGLMNFKPEQGWVDNSALSGKFNTQLPGRASLSNLGLRFKQQSQAADAVRNTFITSYATNIVVRRALDAGTAWATGQAVAVFPVICGIVADEDPDTNSLTRYVIPMGASIDPNVRAVVA